MFTNTSSPSESTPCSMDFRTPSSNPTSSVLRRLPVRKENFAGNDFYVKERVLKDPVEDGAHDFDWAAERRRKIANTNKVHYASGKPSSYQIMMKGGLLPLLSQSDSWIAKRASFAHKSLWVVKDVEGPKGGRCGLVGSTMYHRLVMSLDSVGRWVKEGKGSIDNEDIVLYLTVGVPIT